MTSDELLDQPALVVLLGAMVSVVLCFAVAYIYGMVEIVRKHKILSHMETLGYRRAPSGIWTRRRAVEVLKAADSMPTLGSPKMDATRQKLREQLDSPVYSRLIAALGFLFAAMVVIVAIVAGRASVTLALLPAAIVFPAFHHAIRHTDKSWRSNETVRKGPK